MAQGDGNGPQGSPAHETLEFNRHYAAPSKVVYDAYARMERRMRWTVPDGVTLTYHEAEFRPGGRDRFTCAVAGQPDTHGDVRYEDIVEGARIVFVETLTVDGERVASALNTMLFEPRGGGADFRVVVQVASFVGSVALTGYRQGWPIVMDKLAGELGLA